MSELPAPYPGADLPPIVQRAIARLCDPSVLSDLPALAKIAFAALLRRVSARNPREPFFAKRENVARLLGISQPTVYRTLSILENAGLIIRGEQSNEVGGFRVATVRLTDSAVMLLGLDRDKNADTLYKKNLRRSRVIDAISNQEKQQSLLKKQSTSEACATNGNAKKLSTIDQQKEHKSPSDLDLLKALKLTQVQVYYLMKLAKAKGIRLGDVIAVLTSRLKQLNGGARAVIAYLKTCMAKEYDWAFAVKEQQRISEESKLHTDLEEQRRESINHLKRLGLHRYHRVPQCLLGEHLTIAGVVPYSFYLQSDSCAEFYDEHRTYLGMLQGDALYTVYRKFNTPPERLRCPNHH
jgi:DNA-binding transcriptional ArsR family regulator